MAYPRSYWGDLMTTLHWPRALCFYCFLWWGVLLAPAIHWDRALLAQVAAFAYLQVGSYAVDLLRGNHVGQTHFSRGHLKARAALGVAVAIAIGLYLAWTVSWWLLALLAFGLWGILGYNYEVLGGEDRFGMSRRLMFDITWGAFPVLAHYSLMTVAVPPPTVWAFAVAAAIFSEVKLCSYGGWACRLPATPEQPFCCIMDRGGPKRECHGQAPDVRRAIPKEVHRWAKRQSYLLVYLLLAFTAAVGVQRLL